MYMGMSGAEQGSAEMSGPVSADGGLPADFSADFPVMAPWTEQVSYDAPGDADVGARADVYTDPAERIRLRNVARLHSKRYALARLPRCATSDSSGKKAVDLRYCLLEAEFACLNFHQPNISFTLRRATASGPCP
jgi:hypothetical protein